MTRTKAIQTTRGTSRPLLAVREGFEDDPRRGFRHFADFGRAVRRRCMPGAQSVTDPRLLSLYERNDGPLAGMDWLEPSRYAAAPTGFHQSGATSGEGYLIPGAFREEIFEFAFGDQDLAGMVLREPTGRGWVWALRDESTPWGSAGVQARWKGEDEQLVTSKLETGSSQVQLIPLYVFGLATQELVDDAPLLSARLPRAAGQAIGWTLSEAIVHAAGVHRPQGWLKAPALIEVAKESGQAADTINAANVRKMHARRLLTPGAQYVWLTSSTAVGELFDLTTPNGQPLFRQGDGREGAPAGALLGLPVHLTEHCPVLGDAGDLQLVNLSGYWLPHRDDEIEAATSIHLYFDYALEAFRFMVRVNGQPLLSKPVDPARGSETTSFFISLAERS